MQPDLIAHNNLYSNRFQQNIGCKLFIITSATISVRNHECIQLCVYVAHHARSNNIHDQAL
jgi:hypothetical protein